MYHVSYSSRLKRISSRFIGKTACVILAGGLSKRFGSLKQLAELPNGKSLIQNAVDIANGSKSDYVFVILGYESSEILRILKLGRAQILLNRDYRKGLSSSIRTAISNLPDDCSAATFMLADQPFLTSKLIDKLIDSLLAEKNMKMASLGLENEPRSPAIFSRKTFPLLSKLRGDKGANRLLKSGKSDVILINVKDPWVFLDIDTYSSLENAKRSPKRN